MDGRYGRRRHQNLYRQVVAEFVAKGYDYKTAMEMAGDYLDLYETSGECTRDDNFTRTTCYIRDKEDDE